ncbi:MAG: SDR family NAD(P)-dependent oxidoreductase [Chloroflexi bacterium]|nr:SDR family NAD(P)-dependent oxidoreductase [Chloroflexota bacterium]
MNISGKTAYITGGASGLGEATIKRLHDAGANVMIADFNRENGEALCKALGARAGFAEVDVTKTETVKDGIDLALQKFGAIHILVNCAGSGWVGKTADKYGPHDLDAFKQIVNLNLIGTFDCLRWAAFHMQNNEPGEDGERGVIINTASVAAFEPQMGQVAYAASKAAVVGLTLAVARDLARSGIRCCTIAPGTFDTPLTALMPQEMKDGITQHIPFPKRFGRPVEFAMLVQHIVENSFFNGDTIRLDGAVRFPPK